MHAWTLYYKEKFTVNKQSDNSVNIDVLPWLPFSKLSFYEMITEFGQKIYIHNSYGTMAGSGFFIFNWRVIALQCCAGFCHTALWISHKYTHVHSLLKPSPPSTELTHLGSSQSAVLSPRDRQQPPTSSLFHMWWRLCFHLLSIRPALSFLRCVRKFDLYVCIYFCPANKFISTIFLDSLSFSLSIYIHMYMCGNLWYVFSSFLLHAM